MKSLSDNTLEYEQLIEARNKCTRDSKRYQVVVLLLRNNKLERETLRDRREYERQLDKMAERTRRFEDRDRLVQERIELNNREIAYLSR